MITIKGPDDFARMRRAGKVVAKVHDEVRDAAAPGVSLVELEEIAARIITDAGCTPSFLGYSDPPYPATTCMSVNDEIVHGIPSKRELKEGDILSLDVGAIYEGWHADAAISFGIGDMSAEATQLMEVTERAMWEAIELCMPGTRLGDLGHRISSVAEPYGYGVVREYTGHGIGMQMHEEPQVLNYGRPGKGFKLKTGMAICIEPMFNLGTYETRVKEDRWTVVTADGSLSAHFEHTVAITSDGPEVLTVA